MKNLISYLQQSNIDEVVHFHTDHFEPEIGKIDDVKAFLEEKQKLNFARPMSLFYLSNAFVYNEENKQFEKSKYCDEDNLVLSFLKESQADIHVHVHHEPWTTGGYSGLDYDPQRDSARLNEYLSIYIPYLKNYNLPVKWGFIHGKWALNASDPDVCYISDEIITLKKHGCIGDFSFPAGRGYCDPSIKEPTQIIQIDMARSYDMPEADAKSINSKIEQERFLVWNAQASFFALSLEHVHDGTLPQDKILESWISQSPVINNKLYIRTFCHSMNSKLWVNRKTPLLSTQVAAVFNKLETICDKANKKLSYKTTSEVIDSLTE